MTETTATPTNDAINDSTNGCILINVEVGLPDTGFYPMTLSATEVATNKKLPVITINNDQDCADDGFDVIFNKDLGPQDYVRFNFILSKGWSYQEYPFYSVGSAKNIASTWGWTKAGDLTQAYIDVWNTKTLSWDFEFDLALVDPAKKEVKIDPKLGGRRGS